MKNLTHNKINFSEIERLSAKRGYFVDNNGQMYTPNGTLVQTKNKQGYIKCTVSVNGKNKTLTAHRLVAYSKYKEKIYEAGVLVRHLDGDKLNNKYDNISIGSNSDNSLDVPAEERLARAINASKKTIKYDADEVYNFYIKCGKSRKKTQEHFNISSGGTLHYILKNRKIRKA
jgi:hypothetical protein